MRKGRKIALATLTVFVLIQFIRPERNESSQSLPTDVSKVSALPSTVQTVLQQACYDCHSNNTRYPWYSNIQPFGWLLASHIKNGKRELNFSDFGLYPLRKQRNKLQSIVNSIKDDDMPLASYKWMHPSARLSVAEKTMIIQWAMNTKDSLVNKN